MAGQVSNLARETWGESSDQFATAANTLAELYHAGGDYEKAKDIYPWALQLTRKSRGQNDPEVARILNNLGDLFVDMDNLKLAKNNLTQALEIRQAALPGDHPDLARSLDSLGWLHLTRGDYVQAEELLTQALNIRQAALPADHADIALSLYHVARLHHLLGDYFQARTLGQQALDIQRQALGEQHPDLGQSLHALAQLDHLLADYAQTEERYQEALVIQAAAAGTQTPAYATYLDHLADLHLDLGRFEEAKAGYQQASQIREAIWDKTHPEYAHSVENLARLQYALGDYNNAKGMQQWALQINQKALGPTHPAIADTKDALAQIWQAMGDYARAETLFTEALELRQRILGQEHASVATSLNHLGALYQAMGDYARARPAYQQALDLRQQILSSNHPDIAASLHNLAQLYLEMADYAQARALFEQALEMQSMVLGETHPAYARSLHNLAQLHYATGDVTQAQVCFEQALTVRQAVLGSNHPDVARTLSGLGQSYRTLGRYTEAEDLFLQAHKIWETAGDEAHPDFALSLNNLAELYQDLGDFDQARRFYQWAGQIRKTALGQIHPDVAHTLTNLAATYTALDMIPPALKTIQEATGIHNQMIGDVFSIGSERQRLAYLQRFAHHQATFLSLVEGPLHQSPEAIESGFEMILRRKALGAEALAAQRDALMSEKYPALKDKLAELKALQQRLAQKTLSGPGQESSDTYHQTLRAWNQQREQLEVMLAQEIKEMNLAQKLQSVDQTILAQALPEGSALVELVRFNPFAFKAILANGDPRRQPARYLAFILTADPSTPVQMVDLGEATPIDQMIEDFRYAITGDPGEREDRGLFFGDETEGAEPADVATGLELRTAIFDPLRSALGHCRRLFIAPDGDLNRLPFEVLPLDDGQRLIDDYQINYVSVGRDLLRFGADATGQPTEPVVVADPDFDLAEAQGTDSGGSTSVGIHFGRLPGTVQEGRQIAELLGVSPLTAEVALESRLKAIRSPGILHIATHGFFLPDRAEDSQPDSSAGSKGGHPYGRLAHGLENPLLRSGLALAGINTWLQHRSLPPEAEDGVLTAMDVSGLDLLATDLVVLSACETGLGEVQVGEGVFGLRRAFVLAGAKTLVMSLWKVPDQQTQELMTDFYRCILAGEPRAEALRQAQLGLKEKYPDPLYWGAFICQGEPGPLEY